MHIGQLTGCHQLPERSFSIKGYQFPVCARCCGVMVGQVFSVVTLLLRISVCVPLSMILMGIMFSDWFLQYIEVKESTNPRRFITGILGGFGCWSLYFSFIKKIIRPFTRGN
ncbi:MAG: DUF2085 domain-containing protein [Lachnospiraceae bacterium]|nr:DUF2085 domain-containing protein [Lachnospiraceae bacterium]